MTEMDLSDGSDEWTCNDCGDRIEPRVPDGNVGDCTGCGETWFYVEV